MESTERGRHINDHGFPGFLPGSRAELHGRLSQVSEFRKVILSLDRLQRVWGCVSNCVSALDLESMDEAGDICRAAAAKPDVVGTATDRSDGAVQGSKEGRGGIHADNEWQHESVASVVTLDL